MTCLLSVRLYLLLKNIEQLLNILQGPGAALSAPHMLARLFLPTQNVLLCSSSFCRGSEILSNLPKVTQQVDSRADI